MNLALVAMTDQAEASLREMLGGYPQYAADQTSMNACALVAVDCLAALNEAGEISVDQKIDAIVSRLLAWRRIAGNV